ncbi:MAG TPA: hypothetical protein VK034_32335 [Enhygromyxa sp.]|nr:hypothetical protein [Enhygromyxa sp.]
MNPDRIRIAALGLPIGIAVAALHGCDPYEGSGIPGCDISCPSKGIAEGNAAISGIAEVDAFFGAVLDVSTAANDISSALRAELDAIALSVGLAPGAAGADVRAAIELKLDEAVGAGGLTIGYQTPRCEASVEVAVAAAAECDGSINPGSATVACSGSCSIDGGLTASCDANAVLTCTGTAPEFVCSGTCEGTCELTVAGSCEGTCRGICSGTCSVRDAQDNCAGECVGDCQGTCELAAGGNCSGECTGSCTYQPGEAGCQADASARCQAMADTAVQCAGRCDGEIQPPQVKAECQASVEAKTDASIDCRPPALEITWQWSDQFLADPMAQAQFKAWVKGLEQHAAAMLAARAKADILISALANLGTAGRDALESATGLVAEVDVVGIFKLNSCAIPQLGAAATVVGSASERLVLEADAALEVFGAIGI